MAMRDHWQLPAKSHFRYTGPDWLLLLLDQTSELVRDQLKLLLYNITHQAGPMSIPEAVHGLCAIYSMISEEVPPAADKVEGKGKAPCSGSDNRRKGPERQGELMGSARWEPPPSGWAKCNVDGSFVSQPGEAGVGAVVRDSECQVMLTAWQVIFKCQDPVEAEALACLEGLLLAAQWVQGYVILESDYAQVIQALQQKD